jgi:hypothetical protein
MSLRHPARNYIYYLLSRRTLKIQEVVEHLSELQLPLPQDRIELVAFIQKIQAVQRSMKIPPGFDPRSDAPNPQTRAFFAQWKIAGMWRKDPFVAQAGDYLHEPHIRRALEVMLLGPLTPQLIANRICRRWGLPETSMNPRVVREFAHYFWDYDAFNTSEWMNFIRHHLSGGDNTDYAVSLKVPRTKEGVMVALALADRGADAMSDTEFYSLARSSAMVTFIQHALLDKPSMGRSIAMQNALNTFKLSADELDKHRGASAELLDELRKIDTVHDRLVPTTIHDLPISQLVRALPDGEKKETTT